MLGRLRHNGFIARGKFIPLADHRNPEGDQRGEEERITGNAANFPAVG
jgi:hypothetical protein